MFLWPSLNLCEGKITEELTRIRQSQEEYHPCDRACDQHYNKLALVQIIKKKIILL